MQGPYDAKLKRGVRNSLKTVMLGFLDLPDNILLQRSVLKFWFPSIKLSGSDRERYFKGFIILILIDMNI